MARGRFKPQTIRDRPMRFVRAFLFGTVLFSLCAPVAHAQEYYSSDGGLYWGVRGGLSQVRHLALWTHGGYDPLYTGAPPVLVSVGLNDHLEDRSLEMNYGYVAGASIGYTFAYPDRVADLRFEFEGIYRRNDDGEINSQWTPISNRPDSVSLGFETVPYIGSLEVRSAMFNAFVDFHTPTRFVPYIGLGAGMSQVIAKGYTLDFNRDTHGIFAPQIIDDDLFALSWQAIVGLGYHLSPGTVLTVEGRYFRLAADRWSDLFVTDELRTVTFDDWSVGIRFTF